MRLIFAQKSGCLALALIVTACGGRSDQTAAGGEIADGGIEASAVTNELASGMAASPEEAQSGPGTDDPVATNSSGAASPAASAATGEGVGADSDERSLFQAAGFTFVQKRGQWESGACGDPPMGSYEPGGIERLGDINGDGRPEAFVREGGICYGNMGQHFWLLSQQASGKWKVMLDAIAIPELLATRGTDNFPDIQIGGPGFCFPVVRWNGREYKLDRHQYEGKPCSPPG